MKKFQRKISPDPRAHLLKWSDIDHSNAAPWNRESGYPDDKTSIIVWIALGKLGVDNGFIYEMESGQDMSLDGREGIPFSGNGGGLAVLLLLHMRCDIN